MLTAAELKQIKDYLAQFGKKDSQLPAAETPLTGYEQIAIVQNNINKLTPLSEIQETLHGDLKKDILTYNDYLTLEAQGKVDAATLYVCTTEDGTQVIQIYLQGYPFMPTSDAEFNFNIMIGDTVVNAVFTDSTATTVKLNATASPVASDITFYEGDTTIVGEPHYDCSVATENISINNSKRFKAKAHILGKEMEIIKSITGVKHVYWGAGSSIDTSNATTTTETAHNVPFSITTKIATTAGQYLYFEAPNDWTIDKVELLDTVVTTFNLTTVTANHDNYNAFRTTNAREASGSEGYTYKIYFKQL